MILNPFRIVVQYDFPYTNQHVDRVEECNGSVPQGNGTIMNACVTPYKWEPKGCHKYSAPNNIEHDDRVGVVCRIICSD